MKENTIVSLADSNYFELLNELIDSIRQLENSKNIGICILDAGLNEDQLNILKNKVDDIKKAEWDIKVDNAKIKGREWLKSQVSRAFLPKYFPDFKKYLWIDCDAWVQDWNSIELFFKACESGKLGITQTMTPGYRIMSKVSWVFGKLAIIKSQNFKHAIKSKIPLDKARKLAFAPHINIGVFSLEKDSKCWDVWQNNLKKTLEHGQIFGSEQLAINISVYIDEIETEFLPHNCNWLVSNLMPKFDTQKKIFVEPYLPNNKIGIIHLASGIWQNGKDMRADDTIKVSIKSLDGTNSNKSLRFGKN
ncbi:MAG: glycosyl transferase [Candidatus Pelagibacter sp.]|nr:glycosyl transferase [Candidatus Pelagibacter sp.]|tara:strand:+ start:1809 stop:2723 length:915 start_codon:yes stop_codon:yes gene_type:complete